jgi:DMSO/TMAO reductase YedYZ molybdopterin-dependent catalytic subunit
MKKLAFVFLFAATIAYGQDANISIKVEGRIKNPKVFSFAELKNMPMVHIDSLQLYNHLMVARSTVRNLKGVLLKEVLKNIEFDAASPKDLSEYYITCTATDNYKAVFSWNEIFNSATGDKVMIATEREGIPATAHKEGFLLVTPTDRATGRRHVKELNRIVIQRVN